MANDLNRVTIIGRMTRDADCKQVGNSNIANFSIANGRSYTSNGEKKEETNFFECQVWGKLADVIGQYGGKGKQIAIEGRLKQETWDGQDGKKMSKVKIVVENFQLLGGKSEGTNNQSHSEPDTNHYADNPVDDSVF